MGRLASYKYFNMDQAILNALEMYDNMKVGLSDCLLIVYRCTRAHLPRPPPLTVCS